MIIQEFRFSSPISLDLARKVNKLVYDSDIKEKFDFGEFLFVGIENYEVSAIEVFRLEKFDDGELIPRFLHIIYAPELKRSKEAVIFLMKNEKSLVNLGYKRVWAYILKDRIDMLILARKFGFRDTEFDGKGYTLIKQIGA